MFELAAKRLPTLDELNELKDLLNRFNVSYDEARSVGYSRGNDDSIYSIEGTQAHDYAEKVLTGVLDINDVPELSSINNPMREPVRSYCYECQRIADETGGMEPFVEAKMPLFYNAAEHGTMDYAVVSQEMVRVRDYKHGAGVLVEIEENTQLAIYALSFMLWLEDEGLYAFDPDTVVEIGIVQPRHREWEPDNNWTLTFADLKAFCRDHIQKPHDIIDEGIETVFAPSAEVCRWCRMKAYCGARLHHMSQGLPLGDNRTEAEFLEGLPTYDDRGSEGKFEKAHPEPEERLGIYTESYGVLPIDQIVKIYSNRKGITAFLKDIELYLTRLGLSGTPAPGTKLVIGREGNSAWVNETEADRLLAAEGFDQDERLVVKVVSPTRAKELLGPKVDTKKKNNPLLDKTLAAELDSLITRSPGKKVIALESDKRPAVESNLDGFDDLDEVSETAEMED